MSRQDRVWITGVGTCTPLGATADEFGRRLLSGTSAISPVVLFPAADHPSRIAGQLRDVPCPEGDDPAAFAALPRLERLTRFCCRRALDDAGLWGPHRELRVGVVLGVGAEWMLHWEADGLGHDGDDWSPPLPDATVCARVAASLGLTGPVATVSAACAGGNVALAQARAWLRLGWVDVCLAGGCDTAVSPISLASFGNLRALSRRNDDPTRASRPFDRHRDGFVMSEGGTVFVLERADRAGARTATAYAEVAGYGAAGDAHHLVIPSPDPAPAMRAMRRALADAGVNPEQVDYLNAHATGTPVGDVGEARVLAGVFGDAVGKVPVSSTKSMTGHFLTAAAAVEALACITAMRAGAVPPTINLDEPDPECAMLCHVPHEAREAAVRVAVSNSFGFGGSNTCLVLKAA